MTTPIPRGWRSALAGETDKPYYRELTTFLARERARHTVYPPEDEVFEALARTAYRRTRVVIIGQDPYHQPGQAHGLAFSVRAGVRPPPTLRNIFHELKTDLGCRIPNNGYLVPWAEQGVLLLNTVLTVRANAAGSHRGIGWERFTDRVVAALGKRREPAVFLLWGRYAQDKAGLLAGDRHVLLKAAHPSPLAARHGFFGSRPFSQANAALAAAGQEPIDWQLPDLR